MKIITTTLVFLIAGVIMHLHAEDSAIQFYNTINEDAADIRIRRNIMPECYYGVKSMSMQLFNSDNPYGKNITLSNVCGNYDPPKLIAFIVHGFISVGNNTNNYKLSKSLIQKGYTVFSLDWSNAACTTGLPILKLINYKSAAKNTRDIGDYMASYVIELIEKCNVSLENMLFIGHSLGAHVTAFASKQIQSKGYGLVPRLIAADPAKPLFSGRDCKNKLCKSDAKRVIALHTSALGIPASIGHVDLYFRYGHMQPGCFANIVCSHSKAVVYLNELLEYDCKFVGVPLSLSAIYNRPKTTDCIVVDNVIFNNDHLKDGEYYVFVESQNCTQNTLTCESIAS